MGNLEESGAAVVAGPEQGAQVSVVYLEWALVSVSIERVSGNPGKHGLYPWIKTTA